MPVEIDRGSLLKIARTKGAKGEPLPDWADGDQQLTDAYNEGAGITPDPPATDPPPATTAVTKSPAPKTRPTRAPSTRKTSSTRSSAGARASNPRPAPAGQSAGSWKQQAASRLTPGSAGGVLLAVFAYPVVLATFEAGPAGAVQWLKAKFLNSAPTVGKAAREAPKAPAVGVAPKTSTPSTTPRTTPSSAPRSTFTTTPTRRGLA